MISARYAREIPQRYRLEASKCKHCGHINFPPRIVCPECKAKNFDMISLSDEGKLLSFTVVRVASEKFSKETPYAIGIVELDDGLRLTVQITDADVDELQIGQKVKLVFRKIQEEGKSGILCYGYKAVVVQ
jgi:uncharacterized OB-fold protein